MIGRTEIDAKAKEFEVKTSDVERDYVFGWVLYGIFTASSLKDVIFLKGGNALRKGYLENTRYSADLDFGIPSDISEATLLAELNLVCDVIRERTGVEFLKDRNKVEEKFTAAEAPLPDLKVYEAALYFKDFYGNPERFTIKIAMDVTRFDRTLLPIQTRSLIHPYSDAEKIVCSIRCMKLEEIIATKMKCLLQREHAPDLFDYVYSIRIAGGQIDRQELVQTFIRKTIFDRNPQMAKSILRQTAFDYFRTHWGKAIVCARSALLGVEEAINAFLADLDSLFAIYPDSSYAQFVYFGPELRGPIMKAGRDQTLLKVRYNGADRLVEPYSLKYLQRRDGDAREYLFVYNRSGGSNPPGIRSFVSSGIQAIENTEEKFEPQHQIELCKAGEEPENPYLFDPDRPLQAPRDRGGPRTSRASVRTRSSGMKYQYKCTACGRTFTKSSQSSTLGVHKMMGGWPCGSRSGYFVGYRY